MAIQRLIAAIAKLEAKLYQIYLDEESSQFTAFAFDLGLFEYIVMPMGLQGAPGTFQEAMNEVFE